VKQSSRDNTHKEGRPVENQNVTLVVPKALLRKVKHLAVERETSISGLMVKALEEIVRQNDDYAQAYQRWRESVQHPRDLGTGGKITWTRDELHERR
jgi:predicted transcriptional regulator